MALPSIQSRADAVATWAVATIPALETGYSYVPDERAKLPELVALVAEVLITRADPAFPSLSQIEQTALRVCRFDLVLVVNPDPVDTTTSDLHSYVDLLIASLLTDHTLGGRVQYASPFVAADLSPGVVALPDSTLVRVGTVRVSVADTLT